MGPRVRDDRCKKRDTERDGGTREKGSKREGQRRGAKRGKGQEERAGRGKEQDERRKGGRERRRHERREKVGVYGKEKRVLTWRGEPIPQISSDFIGQKSIKIFLNQCKAFVALFFLLLFPQFSIENADVYSHSFLLHFFKV